MKNITFEGISTLQRLHLCWQIRKQIGKIHQPIKVEFHQPICRKQYSSLWYGGLVVSIKVRGCVFAIHACGDIYATLYDKSDGTELLYVKDKSNSGRFGVDVLPYLKTDHALYAAMGDTHKPVFTAVIPGQSSIGSDPDITVSYTHLTLPTIA